MSFLSITLSILDKGHQGHSQNYIYTIYENLAREWFMMGRSRIVAFPIFLVVAASTYICAIPASAKTVTLKVWTWLADASEANHYKKWVADYEKTHPNVKIKLDVSGGAVTDKILASYTAGEPIDVYRIGCNWLTQFASKGLVRPIDGPMLRDINKNDLLTSVVQSGTFRNKLYGWDPHISGSTLDYNTNIFDKAGLPYPTHGFTWDDLVVAATKTTLTQSGKTTQWGFHDGNLDVLKLIALSNDTSLFDIKTGEPLFLDNTVVKAAELVRKMTLTNGCMPINQQHAWRSLFADGKLGMVVEGTFMNPTYMASKKLKYKVTWTPRGTVQPFLPWPCMWVMSKTSKHPKEQWDFYRHFLDVESSMQFTDFGGPRAYGAPVWKSALKNPKYKVCDMLNEQITQDGFAKPDPRLGFVSVDRFEAEADQVLFKVFSGKMDTRQGMDLLNKRAKVMMKYLGR